MDVERGLVLAVVGPAVRFLISLYVRTFSSSGTLPGPLGVGLQFVSQPLLCL